MNTNNIKKYAPIARRDFIEAVGKRLNQFGVYSKDNTLTFSEPTFSGSVMQIDGNSFDAGLAPARKRLVLRAEQLGFDALVEQVAYTWFNRLCAIRFMELKTDYLEHGFRVLSHPEKANSFEILDHAQDAAEALGLDRDFIVELKLAGNKDEALYRHLLLGQCHQLHQAMPFLFEALDDETELLLPDNLIRTDSILRGLVDGIPEEDWEQVEIIGWLYQFYISEKKDQVIGKVVKSEDIPAATQLFTPNWIVKYLVQNSVGRQWMMTYPDSNLKGQMEYYIAPAEQEAAVTVALAALTPTSIEPETIKVIDPACGSGHILVEAYNLLKAIYEERGYRSRDIPKLILENNLFGLDIDDRAAQLAGFALMMKAREDDRRIFTRDIKLNVLALQSTHGLDLPELWRKLDLNNVLQIGTTESIFDDAQSNLIDVVDDVDYTALESVLVLFEQAKTFGSLIQVPHDKAEFLCDLKNQLELLIEQGDNYKKMAATVLLPFVRQAWFLAQRYDAVIANPPYMGAKYYDDSLKQFVEINYKLAKGDLYTCFIVRNTVLTKAYGIVGMITIPNWMFLSTFEGLRDLLFAQVTIETLLHNGRGIFGSDFGSCAFTFRHQELTNYNGIYKRLFEKQGSVASNEELERRFFTSKYFETSTTDFKTIPSSPVAYWVSKKLRSVFSGNSLLSALANVKQGLATADNDRFLRLWPEVSNAKIGLSFGSREDAQKSGKKWFPYSKGGGFRKWYGNRELLVNWECDGDEIRSFCDESGKVKSRPQALDYYFRESLTWTLISSGTTAFRYEPKGNLIGHKGPGIFLDQDQLFGTLALLNSCVSVALLKILAPTIGFEIGQVAQIPVLEVDGVNVDPVRIARDDWNSFEVSWDFQKNPLVVGWVRDSTCAPEGITQQIDAKDVGLRDKAANPTYNLSTIYADWQTQNRQTIAEMQRLEQENNHLFIDAYGLQDELDADVPLEQITLTVNPKYRYGGNLNDEQLAQRFQSDTLAELISYAIGCMMGRYRLDKPGLIYAHSGNIDFDKIYNDGTTPPFGKGGLGGDFTIGQIPPNPPFSKGGIDDLVGGNPFNADDDGIIPLTDQEWFKDDATNRFRDFVRTVWGEDNLQENLAFVAESLCLSGLTAKRGEQSLETIRRYLSNQFYKNHLKTYKKRPIYWLFSSGKQKGFECLVYLHRYNESTLSRMRTGYVTPLLGKYDSFAMQLNKQMEDASTTEATRLKKDLIALEKKQTELRAFDDKLKHYADMRIKIDLDDGVKINYGKFGDLLVDVKAVTGGKGE